MSILSEQLSHLYQYLKSENVICCFVLPQCLPQFAATKQSIGMALGIDVDCEMKWDKDYFITMKYFISTRKILPILNPRKQNRRQSLVSNSHIRTTEIISSPCVIFFK